MNTEDAFALKGIKYIVLAAVAVLIVIALSFIPRREDNHDTWLVEVKVLEKVIAEMDGEQVYLLKTEDREGREALYEINQEALNERLKVEGMYGEFKSGKYYKFRAAGKERYDSHYPVVCGAVSLIEGFSETPES